MTHVQQVNSAERDRLMALFEQRKTENKAKEKIDNSKLWAGSPMYYYCRACDGLADTKPESFDPRTNPIKRYCKDCQELINQGYLQQ